MPEVETTVLSYGMGVESTAILLRWCLEEDTRPCPLDRIVVITAQVGDEYEDTGRDVQTYMLPMMRCHTKGGFAPPVGGWMVVTLTSTIEKNETMSRQQL